MNAVEFEAIIEDNIIRIPDGIKGKVGKQVKVILLSEETEKKEGDIANFSAVSYNTKGFKFDRDEANERTGFY